MSHIDLAFPLLATHSIPADHGYHLYSALSRLVPEVHRQNGMAVHPIRGQQTGNRQLALTDRSRLVLRTNTENIAPLIQIAGKSLQIGSVSVRVGVPQVWPLKPTPSLRSRLVVIKVSDVDASQLTAETFLAAAQKQLAALGISDQAQLSIPCSRDGTSPQRRTLRIKDKEVVGYEVIIEGLTAEESLNIQEQGLGGRRHMGCGVFAPFVQREGGGHD